MGLGKREVPTKESRVGRGRRRGARVLDVRSEWETGLSRARRGALHVRRGTAPRVRTEETRGVRQAVEGPARINTETKR